MKRSEQKISEKINVSPEAAWEVIGAVNGVDNWLAPMITSCRVEGEKRICGTEEGEFEEDILLVDHENYVFKYAIPKQHLMPVENIEGTIRVLGSEDNQAVVEWHWTFDVLEDNEAQAKEMLAGIGAHGIKGIESYISATTQ